MKHFFIAALCAAIALPGAAQAELFGSKNKGAIFKSKTRVLDTRARLETKSTVRLDANKVITPTKWGTAEPYSGKYRGQYLEMARAAAERHNIPQDLFLRLVQQESNWNPKALSHKGAIGLAQLMPGTASLLGVDPHDPYENLEGGARYLAQQYRNFKSCGLHWRPTMPAQRRLRNTVAYRLSRKPRIM